jgi:NAD(P)-dependent dehydrogenase (short-subunit alcohol dehydrogenase family)
MGRLDNKNIIITGAAGGQGEVACRRFCEEGATVLGTDIDEAGGQKLADALQADGAAFSFVAADVATRTGVEAVTEHARTTLAGRVDGLYNNHGIILGKPLLETTEQEWDRIHDVDLKSVFLLTTAIAPLMGDGGSIINVSSAGGLVALPNMTAYGAAKGGLAMFSRGAAVDLAPLGIRVNAICPGVVDTQMPRDFVGGLGDAAEATWDAFAGAHLLNRVGRADEVVGLAVYLASDESTFMTGAVIPIDGGYTTR